LSYRSRGQEAVVHCILQGQVAVPDVHAVLSVRELAVTPRVQTSMQATSARVLPLGLRGQTFVEVAAVGLRVVPAHVDNRVIQTSRFSDFVRV
jgi:hypothetical protein